MAKPRKRPKIRLMEHHRRRKPTQTQPPFEKRKLPKPKQPVPEAAIGIQVGEKEGTAVGEEEGADGKPFDEDAERRSIVEKGKDLRISTRKRFNDERKTRIVREGSKT